MFLLVYSGNSSKFVDFRRPSKIGVAFPDGSSQDIDLADTRTSSRSSVSKDGIDSLRIEVLDTNGPDDGPHLHLGARVQQEDLGRPRGDLAADAQGLQHQRVLAALA